MISFCIATRKRPELYKQLCLSAFNTASEPNDIEFISYHDDDDDSIYEYVGNHREVIGKRSNPQAVVNECQKIATGPIYYFGADDLMFQSIGWDKKVKEAFDNCPDKILFVYPNDHWHRSNFGNSGFLHKNWIDTVGYLARPDLVRYGDCWINEVANKIGRRLYINGIGVKHFNIKTDETHAELISQIEESQCEEKYDSKELQDAKQKDVELLRDFINNFKS